MFHPAYVAGLVDGEGSIGIRKRKRSTTRRGYNYQIAVRISNNCEAVLQEVKAQYGGHITCRGIFVDPRGIRRVHANYDWQCASKVAARILRDIQPYLYIKRKQCELALNMADRTYYVGTALPEEEWNLRDEQFETMKQLNNRHGSREGENLLLENNPTC